MPPMYTFECPSCATREDHFRHVDERNDSPEHCGKGMERVILPPAVHADLPAYQSPIDGREVRGRRARAEDLKRNGCRPWEGKETEKQIAASWQQSQELKSDKALEADVHEVVSNSGAAIQQAIKTGEWK